MREVSTLLASWSLLVLGRSLRRDIGRLRSKQALHLWIHRQLSSVLARDLGRGRGLCLSAEPVSSVPQREYRFMVCPYQMTGAF